MPEELSTVNEEPCERLSLFQEPALQVLRFLEAQGVARKLEWDDLYWDLGHTLRVLHIRPADVYHHLRDLPLPQLGTPPRAMVSSVDLLTWLAWGSPLPLCKDFTTWLWETYLPMLAAVDVPGPDGTTGQLPHPAGQDGQKGAQ